MGRSSCLPQGQQTKQSDNWPWNHQVHLCVIKDFCRVFAFMSVIECKFNHILCKYFNVHTHMRVYQKTVPVRSYVSCRCLPSSNSHPWNTDLSICGWHHISMGPLRSAWNIQLEGQGCSPWYWCGSAAPHTVAPNKSKSIRWQFTTLGKQSPVEYIVGWFKD